MLFYKCDACRVDVSNEDVCCVNLHKGFSNESKHLCPSCYDTIRKFMSAWDTPEKENDTKKTVTASSDFFVKETVADVVEDDSIAIWVSHTEDAKVEEPEKKKKSTLSEEDRDTILKMYKSGVTSATKISKSLNLPYHAVYYYINKLKLYNVRVQEKPTGEPRVPKSKPPMVIPPRQKPSASLRNVSDEERQQIYANIAKQKNVSASNVGTVHSLSKAGWSPKSIAYDCLDGKIELVKDILFELHKAGI